jgi:hypothetical protein
VYIGDLVPQSGNLLLDFSTTAEAAYGFNGGLIIMEYSDAAGGAVTNAVLDSTSMYDNVAQANDDANMHVYPNPFLDVINVDFFNKSAGDRITAEVYDLTGRLVLRQDFNTMPVGRNLLQLRNIEANKATSLCLVALKVNGKIVQTAKMIRVIKK